MRQGGRVGGWEEGKREEKEEKCPDREGKQLEIELAKTKS